MNIRNITRIGQCEKRKATIKAYRQYPGHFDTAAHAAWYYAKKEGQRMFLVPGNSNMCKVYHISVEDQNSRSFATTFIGRKEFVAGIVEVDGSVWQCVVSKS